LVYTVGII